MNLYLAILYFHAVNSVFYEQENGNKCSSKDVIVEQITDSQLQCVHFCHRIDRETCVLFEKPTCKCVEIVNEDRVTIIGEGVSSRIFIQKKLTMNAIEEETIGSENTVEPGKTVEKEKKLTNIGLNKPSVLSSTYRECYARYANDGDELKKATTRGHGFGWWRLDLEKESTIDHLTIHLGNTAFERGKFKDLQIKTSLDNNVWKLCKKVGVPSEIQFNVTCDEGQVTARYVKLEDPNKISLFEVSVIGYEN